MGQYEPNDSRDVTLSDQTAPGEPERTGPREGEARRQAQQGQSQSSDGGSQSQVAYGNSRDEDGAMEQDKATEDARKDVVGETSPDPAARAKADAARPLDEA